MLHSVYTHLVLTSNNQLIALKRRSTTGCCDEIKGNKDCDDSNYFNTASGKTLKSVYDVCCQNDNTKYCN
ncbi:hypothetical protein CASFOL_020602 [Castilleja foliolosa]|uniref:Uncharacterized protein n=1 Tax=Castilleja foliolosa TaxID=1961234 RepID=A0ABD3D536_9LAMI